MPIAELGRLAVTSDNPTAIAGRCTVFAESDMIHKQQLGHPQSDILMGLCQALVRNFIGNVARGKTLAAPVLLQGGVSANPAIRRAFEEALGHPVIIPRYSMVMGAFGAALLARDAAAGRSSFRGMAVSNRDIATRGVLCTECANQCELVEIIEDGAVSGRTGGRCGKW
jgi:activator of 2-hydroxyglutaryl-CoA dehydratase